MPPTSAHPRIQASHRPHLERLLEEVSEPLRELVGEEPKRREGGRDVRLCQAVLAAAQPTASCGQREVELGQGLGGGRVLNLEDHVMG